MTREMLLLEDQARQAGKGIWAKDSDDRLFTPDELAGKTGTVQVVEQRSARCVMVAVRRFQERPHMILRGQHRRDQLVRGWNVTLAHPVEGRFAMMREGGERIEAEHRARALQRMKAPEDRVDLVAVVEAAGEVEKAGLDLFQQFGRFCPED